jgi:hypothetical protein
MPSFITHVDISQKLQAPTLALFTHQNSWYGIGGGTANGFRGRLSASFKGVISRV